MKKIKTYEQFKYIKLFEDEQKPNTDGTDEIALLIIKNSIKYLMTKFQFFIVFFTRLRIAEYSGIETMATDGKSILYNPTFVKKCGVAKTTFILIHEILHNANLHFLRVGNRNSTLWNVAGDYAINGQIKDMLNDMKISATDIEIPTDILLDTKYKNMSAEGIYKYLEETMPPPPPKPKPEPEP